jgi:4-diphosphocytidyl-2-C-methyl-D-erythritol kinase
MPIGDLRTIALNGRNDLEPSALALVPQIGIVLAALRETGPLVARMSGSGATCFAIYESHESMTLADKVLSILQPDWWRLSGALR